MDIIITIVIGFVAGLLARFFMPGKDAMGLILTTLLGIGGAFLAKIVGGQLNLYPSGGFGQFVASVIGAFVILLIYKFTLGKKK